MILDAYFRIFWLLVKMLIPRLESNPQRDSVCGGGVVLRGDECMKVGPS